MMKRISNKAALLIMLAVGFVTVAATALVGIYLGRRDAQRTMDRTVYYLERQCVTYREIIVADEVKSLVRLTEQAAESCENHDLPDRMVIGTSALADTEIDGAVGMYSGIFNNPFLIWGKYHKGLFRTTLKLSFQFHHTQMDGAHAAHFLRLLQEAIFGLKTI